MKFKRLIAITLTTTSLLSVPKLSEASSALFNRSGNYLVLVKDKITGYAIKNPLSIRQFIRISSDADFIIMRKECIPINNQGCRYRNWSSAKKTILLVIKEDERIVVKFLPQDQPKKVNLVVTFSESKSL